MNITSYMTLYKFFAWIIMPKKNHKKSRDIFVREAEKLGKVEFCRWVLFISDLRDISRFIDIINTSKYEIQLLYIMGNEDHLFAKTIIRHSSRIKNASVVYINGSGHVCNIEKPEEFNSLAINFFKTNNA